MVEVLPVDLEGSTWALSLEEQVEMVVLGFLPWVLPHISGMGQQLVLLVPIPVEEQVEFYASWDEVQPPLSISVAEN